MPLKQTYAEAEEGQPGDFWFSAGDTYIVIRLFTERTKVHDVHWDEEKQESVDIIHEFDEGLCILPIKPGVSPRNVYWNWDGNRQAPTLSPSILHHSQDPWHGWMRAGVLVPA